MAGQDCNIAYREWLNITVVVEAAVAFIMEVIRLEMEDWAVAEQGRQSAA
jgi:hypothetical protein